LKEINIARVIIDKRKEKGITQEELANHIGVTIAAVSKWETAQSYPDILLLPQLAAYFNISIDELMRYEPQMTKKEIGKLYCKLYEDFNNKPFDEVISECRRVVKKHFSCFPLVLQMGDLLLVSSGMTDDKEKSTALVAEAKELFVRVKTESDNAELMKSAMYMEACCAAALSDYNRVIALLENTAEVWSPYESLLSTAYRMTGRNAEAETVLQVGIYQNVISTLGLLSSYVMLGVDDVEKFDETVERTLSLVKAFNIKKIFPSLLLNFSGAAAQGYLLKQNVEKSLDLLELYAELITSDLSSRLNEDSFFNLVGDKPDEYSIADIAMPDEILKQSLTDTIINNPVFSVLNDNLRFQTIAKKLEGLL